MMDQHKEIEALRDHFEARGLDVADAIAVCTALVGINVGLAADDEAGLNLRLEIVAGSIGETAQRIVKARGAS